MLITPRGHINRSDGLKLIKERFLSGMQEIPRKPISGYSDSLSFALNCICYAIIAHCILTNVTSVKSSENGNFP